MTLTINSRIKLNNGVEIPIFGLGTWLLSGKNAYDAVLVALESGYRLIDTATIYENEREIGRAIKDSGVPREEIFLTTKVWQTDMENAQSAFDRSLRVLDVEYIDLYLIHWPITESRINTWKVLEKIYESGKARAIGVSNYTNRHLDEHFEHFDFTPVVNQVEFSPFLYQKELLEYCMNKGIYLEAYCPLTRGRKLDNATLKFIGKKYNKTPAQILIRWGLQHDIIQIPKSGNRKHIIENVNVFDFKILEEDMKLLDSLNEDFRVVEDPAIYD